MATRGCLGPPNCGQKPPRGLWPRSPLVPPDSPVRRLALRGPGVVEPHGRGGASAQHPGRSSASAGRRRVRAQLGGQRDRPRAPGFGDEYVASRRYAGRGPGAPVARRGAGVAFVARLAAAADAQAQALAPGARWRPMIQAERALRAAAHPWRATALWCRERDDAGRRPRGPLGIHEQRRPPLEGAEEVIHRKGATEHWPNACRRPQAPDPRLTAKKNYTTRRLFGYTHLPQKKKLHELQHTQHILPASREMCSSQYKGAHAQFCR